MGFFKISVSKHQKIEGRPFEVIKTFLKKSQYQKKLKGGFSTTILSQNVKKLKGDPLGFFFRESLNAEKKLKRDTLVSLGIVCYAEKKEKPCGSVF